MVNSKIGVQDWSKSVQKHDFKDEKWNFAAANKQVEEKGAKDVGDLLNTVVNPGSAKEKTAHRKPKNELGKDDFLKLMLTQMKNQNPLNPMESHEMAAQLAQFTSLEQLQNVNTNLTDLKQGQDPMQKFQSLNLLGRTIQSDSKYIFRDVTDRTTDLRFELGKDATKGLVTVQNEKGEKIKTIEYGVLKKGLNKITWDGTDDNKRPIPPGKYLFSVEATDMNGNRVATKTETSGMITGVNYTPEGPLLMVGDQKVRLQDIQKIEDADLKAHANHMEAQATANPFVKPETPSEKAEAKQEDKKEVPPQIDPNALAQLAQNQVNLINKQGGNDGRK